MISEAFRVIGTLRNSCENAGLPYAMVHTTVSTKILNKIFLQFLDMKILLQYTPPSTVISRPTIPTVLRKKPNHLARSSGTIPVQYITQSQYTSMFDQIAMCTI